MTLLDEIIAKGRAYDFEGAFRDLFGLEKGGKKPENQQISEVVKELQTLTTDDTEEAVLLRGLTVWRAIVRHVKAGGTVKFLGPGTEVKTMKVRLR